MNTPPQTVDPELREAADNWARDHGCRGIEWCCKTPLEAFEAGARAERVLLVGSGEVSINTVRRRAGLKPWPEGTL